MALYEMTSDAFRPLSQAKFADLKVRERDDLQRLLRSQIDVLGDDLYVLTEEFGDWDDSRRRIDLLAIDLQANLVVIELKRTNDGGHMELQAIRYASMVSAMTFDRAEQIHEFLLRTAGTILWAILGAPNSHHFVLLQGVRESRAIMANAAPAMKGTMGTAILGRLPSHGERVVGPEPSHSAQFDRSVEMVTALTITCSTTNPPGC